MIQLGSCPPTNRGARANLLTIHQRLQGRGHQSTVVDLTPFKHVKEPGVYYPRSLYELARLLWEIPADVLHLHIGSSLTFPKLALAAIANRLPPAKKICTLHLGGRFYPKRGLRACRWGATARVLRQFDTLVAVNAEIASFFERVGVLANRVHLITPFPRLRVAERAALSDEIETFCRHHTPLLVSVGEFEPGSDLPMQFDILSKVRERYPSAGLIAIGGGSLHFKYAYERALHPGGNHIELTGALSEAATSELIQRSNVLLQSDDFNGNAFPIHEARKARTPVVAIGEASHFSGRCTPGVGGAEASALQVLRSLQIARPRYEDAPPALSDGVDDVIGLYRQLTANQEQRMPLPAGYEWPSIGWGL